MPISLTIIEATRPTATKTGKRYTAIFRLHKGGPVIKITHFGQRNPVKGTYIDHGDKKLKIYNLLRINLISFKYIKYAEFRSENQEGFKR